MMGITAFSLSGSPTFKMYALVNSFSRTRKLMKSVRRHHQSLMRASGNQFIPIGQKYTRNSFRREVARTNQSWKALKSSIWEVLVTVARVRASVVPKAPIKIFQTDLVKKHAPQRNKRYRRVRLRSRVFSIIQHIRVCKLLWVQSILSIA